MADRKRSKFGIEPVTIPSEKSSDRRKSKGPMSAAVQDAAGSLTETVAARTEARKRNTEDANAFRVAQQEGRILQYLSVSYVHTDDLPRDRLDLDSLASSEEMDELKASIRAQGQQEAIEVFTDENGSHQLVKGWRRLHALKSLFQETGEVRFSQVLARVDVRSVDRVEIYQRMVEENIIRQDLSLAEMAHVAIVAKQDTSVEVDDVGDVVTRIFSSLAKQKRTYIRLFVELLEKLEADLKFPKALSRDLGAELAHKLRSKGVAIEAFRAELKVVESAARQEEVIRHFLSVSKEGRSPPASQSSRARKFEVRVGDTKLTAKSGELRLKSPIDYSQVSRERLEQALLAFNEVIEGK